MHWDRTGLHQQRNLRIEIGNGIKDLSRTNTDEICALYLDTGI
jgi:hypothetical protein